MGIEHRQILLHDAVIADVLENAQEDGIRLPIDLLEFYFGQGI